MENIRDFLDLEMLEDVMSEWSKATGMATIAMDNNNEYLTGEIGFMDFCTKYTRGSKEGLRRCIMSDACKEGVYYCHAGLMDFSMDICLENGTRLGKIIGGQILPQKPDPEKFRELARELGIDEEEYLKALSKIDIRSEDAIRASAYLLGKIVNLMVNAEYVKKRQEKVINNLDEENKRDPMTMLYNKSVLEKMIPERIAEEKPMAVIIIDIDNFKSINDTYGHITGDYVLKTLAWKIKNAFRSTDIVGRFGGDEFYIIIDGERTDEALAGYGERICKLARGVKSSGMNEEITVSVGIAAYPRHGKDYNSLFGCADAALYAAKKTGKNHYSLYTS